MERTDLDRAMADVLGADKPPARLALSCSLKLNDGAAREAAERVRMFAKLTTLYPIAGTQDTRDLIAALTDETQDIPAFWVSCGLAAIVRGPARAFCPSISEIRSAALQAIRAARWTVEGAPNTSDLSRVPLHPDRELAWAWVRGFKREAALAGLPVELRRIRYPDPPAFPVERPETVIPATIDLSAYRSEGSKEIAAPRPDVTEYGEPEMP